MATNPYYKFKPYSFNRGVALTNPSFSTPQSDTVKALEAQKRNLEKRLKAQGVTDTGERNAIERALNLDPNQGVLMDFFEVLDRPGQAVKGALTSKDGILKGAWEGLSGQSEMTGTEFLDAQGFSTAGMSGFTKFVFDLGADIVTDPLNLIPAGAISGKLFDKTVIKTREVWKKVGEDAVIKLTKVDEYADAVRKVMDTDVAISGLDDIAREAEFQRRLQKDLWDKEGIKYVADTQMAEYRTLGADTANRTKNQSEILHRLSPVEGGLAGSIPENKTADSLAKQIQGLPKSEASDGLEIIQGIPGGQDVAQRYNQLKNLQENKLADMFNKDIIITKKTKHGGSVIVGQVEVKQLQHADYGKLAYTKRGKQYTQGLTQDIQAATFSVKMDNGVVFVSNNTAFGNVSIGFAADAGSKLDQRFVDRMENFLNRQGIEAYKGANPKRRVYDDFANFLKKDPKSRAYFFKNAADEQEYIDILLDLSFNRGTVEELKYVHFTDNAGVLHTYAVDDVFKGTHTTFRPQAHGDGRINPTFQIDWDKLMKAEKAGTIKDYGDDWVAEVLEKSMKQDEVTKTMTTASETVKTVEVYSEVQKGAISKMLGFVSDKLPASVKEVMKPVTDAFEKMAASLNATKYYDINFINKILSIEGVNGTKLQESGRRLSKLTKDILSANPGSEKEVMRKLYNILESSVYFDEAGNIAYKANKWTVGEIADDLMKQLDEGNIHMVLGFSNEMAARNVMTQLNEQFGEEIFTVSVSKRGTAVLSLNDGVYSADDAISYLDNLKSLDSGMELDLGSIKLDKETEEFLKANKDLVSDYGKVRDEMVDVLVNEVGYKDLPEFLKGRYGYMRHNLSAEAKAGMAGSKQAARSKYYKDGVKLLGERQYLGGAEQINAIFKDFYDVGVDVFDINAHSSLENFIRLTMNNKEQKDMVMAILQGTDKNGGSLFKVIGNTVDDAKQLPPSMKLLTDGFEGEFSAMFKNLAPDTQEVLKQYFKEMGYDPKTMKVAINRSAYETLARVNKGFVDLPDLVKGYDKFLNAWKSVTLVSPGFHMRNLFGNMTNMYLVGMGPAAQMKYTTAAQKTMMNYRQVVDALASGKNLDTIIKEMPGAVEEYKKLLTFYQSGVAQTHKGVRDLDTIREMLEQGGKKSLPRELIEFNFTLAENMDDFQRYALYQWAYDTEMAKIGNTVSKNQADVMARSMASQKVRNSLFDYTNLTTTEREYMKRLFPFYTFMKNNLVFQMKNIVDNPVKYANLGRAYNYAVEDLGGMSMEDMPDYMRDNMWLPLPFKVNKNDKQAIAFLKLNLPIADFTEFVENPLKKGATSITAPIKLFWELGTGIDSFTGAKIRNFPGEENRMTAEQGVLAGIRDSKGNLSFAGDPVLQKIGNDIGFRVPKNYASIILDAMDTARGYQGMGEFGLDTAARLGLVGVQTQDNLELTQLYQDLEQLRYLQKLYEQETGQKLPTLP